MANSDLQRCNERWYVREQHKNIVPSGAQLVLIADWVQTFGAQRVEIHQRPSDGRVKAWIMDADGKVIDRLKIGYEGNLE